jgi:hypothetical protein
MSPDPEELARFVRVEPPAELDAWMRARLRAAVTEHARATADGAATSSSATPDGALHARAPEPSRATPARVPVSIPLAERLVLALGAVACAVQASGLVIRIVWSALTLGR